MGKVLKIGLFNTDENVLDELYIKDFNVKEDFIINKSITKYNTDEPCIIYRTCIINEVYLKLDEYFRSELNRGVKEIKVRDFPSYLIDSLDLPYNVNKMRIL